jgi:hypothetical protein
VSLFYVIAHQGAQALGRVYEPQHSGRARLMAIIRGGAQYVESTTRSLLVAWALPRLPLAHLAEHSDQRKEERRATWRRLTAQPIANDNAPAWKPRRRALGDRHRDVPGVAPALRTRMVMKGRLARIAGLPW